MRRIHVLLVSATALLFLGSPAAAHGDLRRTNPEDGSTVGDAPSSISITLTEAPSEGAEARAFDGCKRRVPAAVSVSGSDIVLATQGGEPGGWTVIYRALSSVDGHQVRGTFAFTVRGKKDCSGGEAGEPEDQVDAAKGPGIIENPNPPDEGGTSWLVWLGGGTVVLIAAAFAIRRSSR